MVGVQWAWDGNQVRRAVQIAAVLLKANSEPVDENTLAGGSALRCFDGCVED
jgi:hypothetical protein